MSAKEKYSCQANGNTSSVGKECGDGQPFCKCFIGKKIFHNKSTIVRMIKNFKQEISECIRALSFRETKRLVFGFND